MLSILCTLLVPGFNPVKAVVPSYLQAAFAVVSVGVKYAVPPLMEVTLTILGFGIS
jgi:hypothetical protein